MSMKRKVYSPSFRAKVAVRAIRGDKSIHEIAAEYEVSPRMVMNWKKRLQDHVDELFQDHRVKRKEETTKESELFEQIGRLKMEIDWLKKKASASTKKRRGMVGLNCSDISITRQCELVGLPRSTYYFQPQAESEHNLKLMQKIDELYMDHPFYGCRKMGQVLGIDKDHANRLMRKMGIDAIYPKPKITSPNVENEVFPYLLRNVKIDRPNQV